MEPQNQQQKKVLIVDDHPMICEGIAMLVEHEPDLSVVGRAASANEALEAIEKLKPDVVVVDITLKDSSGMELIKDMKIRWPNLPALVFSMHSESFFAARVLHAGARAYVSKRESPATVVEAIRKVLGGGLYVSEDMTSAIVRRFVMGQSELDRSRVGGLTDREFQVFQMIGEGHQTREIADKLHVSIKTVETHRERIKKKLNLDSSARLAKYAIEWAQAEKEGT
ncbi:MAG: response regulator [Planctomycetota bacterium]|jgi:DNA-binding NarL/FixJ family response regulator